MPKETFFNLSEDKKEKIYGAAVKEFSAKRFSEASINKIVREAGIPRGSFYQYFSGKEDIYAYIADEIAKEQAVVMKFIERPEAAGALEELIFKARAALELFRVRPEYRKIAMYANKDEEPIEGPRLFTAEDIDRIKELFMRGQLRGQIKPDVDSGLVTGMVCSLVANEVLKAGQDREAALKRIKEILRAINKGIAM